METNDIKNIWKSGIDTIIKAYSDSELDDIVVKSARKSMRTIQPKGVFQVIVIAVIIYIIIKLISWK